MTVVFRPASVVDIEDAYRWYTSQSDELGADFLEAIQEATERITSHPQAYPILRREIRRIRLRRFPYGILYRVRGDDIAVVACFHAARNPKKWWSRS